MDGVNVVCDAGPSWPLAPTCDAAIAAALPAANQSASAIDFVEYHFGSYCPPGVPCGSAFPSSGYLIVRLKANGAVVLVTVSADASGRVSVGSPQPFASTPPGM